MMHDSMGGMSGTMGLTFVLVVAVLVLGVAALIKYLFRGD